MRFVRRSSFVIIVLLSGILFLGFRPHPIHISVCEIDYNIKEAYFEGALKIFSDDLELELKQDFNFHTIFDSPKYSTQTPQFLQKYLTRKIHLFAFSNEKSKPVSLAVKYHAHEQETDAQWIYFTTEQLNFEPKEFTIQNLVLLDQYGDQINFTHFQYKGQKKTIRFHKGEKLAKIILK